MKKFIAVLAIAFLASCTCSTTEPANIDSTLIKKDSVLKIDSVKKIDSTVKK